MTLPSFDDEWVDSQVDSQRTKPRIQVLEIRHRDRPNAEPIASLLVERQEAYRHDSQDNTPYQATISLSYQRIKAKFSRQDCGNDRFDGSYSKSFNSVSLTSPSMSNGAVFLDLPELYGQRIGTYLMNEIVRWVQRWPEATVNSIELSPGQANGANKERRNRFYEQFGLVFDYTDTERQGGHSRPMLAGDLITVETWKQNITECRMHDYLADVLYAEQRASSELEARDRACKSMIAERRKAEDHPIWWALKILYYRYAGTVVVGAVLAVLLAVVWSKLKI